jgi:hypothetical protein
MISIGDITYIRDPPVVILYRGSTAFTAITATLLQLHPLYRHGTMIELFPKLLI